MSRRWIRFALLAILVSWFTAPARSQDYPSRPVTMIEPFPPGSAIARLIADGMRVSLGQPVIIENVSGAGGTIGVARVARAAPDGYTICIGQPVSHVFSAAVYNVRYDLLNDFEPIALLVSSPLWLVGKASLPADSVDALVAWLRANPGKASFATIGHASPSHVWGIEFQSITGTRFQFVPYRGGPPAAQALVAGEVDISSLSAPLTLPLVRSGQIKAYAVLGKMRWRGAPEIPTIAEAGVPGLPVSLWYGLWAPKGTPRDIIARLNAAVVATLGDPAVASRFADLGNEIFPRAQQTPEALHALQKVEIEKWWPLIKAANIGVE